MTGKGGTLDIAAAEGGTVVSIPARLHHGWREGHNSDRGTSLTEDPQFGSLRSYCYDFEGTKHWLQKYQWRRQKFPLQLQQVEEQDQVTQNFGKLRERCMEMDPTKQPWNNWISQEIWQLIAHRAMLRHTGHLCQTGGHCLHCQIGASLHKDQADCTANAGANIDTKLAGGNV
jgi:hypothetical protein